MGAAMKPPETKYAKSGDVSIAYQVVGDGSMDLVLIPGYISHLELLWEEPHVVRFVERLASFARVIPFDKRGTGMSDPVTVVPTLEERMDDIRAVMDAASSERAAMLAISEGAPLAILFAATYPDRCRALVLAGGLARSTWAPDYDYPWAPRVEDLAQSAEQYMLPSWGTGDLIEIFAPSLADDPAAHNWFGRLQRFGASPAMLAQIHQMFLDVDVRHALPAVHVPTLVLHRRGDRVVNRRAGQWLAEHIAGARYVELPGADHSLYAGDQDRALAEIEEFLTGTRGAAEPDRVLATLLFTDIVGSTDRAAAVGDRRWKELLDLHDGIVAKQVEAARGRLVKRMGDGCLATFDGPGRAIRCAVAVGEELRSVGLDVRAGVHTGEVELRGEDLGGIAVNIASRVADLAGGGEVLVSSTVKDLVAGSGIGFEDRGAHVLKGVPDEWRLYAVKSG
jgi:class 3 adenylate cyclase